VFIDLLHRSIRLRYHRLGFRSRVLAQKSCTIHYYRRENEESPRHIVLIHGLGTSSSTWIKILPSLIRYGTITCIDLPGFGFSEITSGAAFFSLAQFDESLDIFFSALKKVPAILIGHSLGGWLSVRLAIKKPELIERLILIDNAGINYAGVEQQAQAFRIRNVNDVRSLLDRMWFRYPWYFAPLTRSVYHSLRSKHVADFVASVQEKDFINSRPFSFAKPVDAIWGDEDHLIPIESVEAQRKIIPQLRLHTVPRCGHVPQLERPRDLAILLKQILASADASHLRQA
jgi:pimeloyl-ACP methyl ester carboxylesterase